MSSDCLNTFFSVSIARKSTLSPVLLPLAFCLLAVPGGAQTKPASPVAEACRAAAPLELDAISRGAGFGAGEVSCHQFELEAGLRVDLELAQPAAAPAARLALLDEQCRPADLTFLERRSSQLSVAAVGSSPSTFFACVGPQDPRRVLGHYKILAATSPGTDRCGRSVSDPIEVEPEGLAAVTDRSVSDPIEVEPEGLMDGCGRSVSDPIEVEPEGLTVAWGHSVSDPIEVEPEGLVGSCGRSVSDPIEVEPEGLRGGIRRAPCALDVGDEASDGLRCARRLDGVAAGVVVRARLENGFGDDQDAYRFQVTDRMDLEARIVGPAGSGLPGTGLPGAALALFDNSGRRLAFTGTEDEGMLRMTLDAGEYVVRAEAEGEVGAYRLSLRAAGLDW